MDWKRGIYMTLFSFFVATSAFSQVNTKGLTAEQQQTLQEIANKMKSKPTEAEQVLKLVESVDVNKLQQWSELGTETGKAVANFAREIGVAAQEFLNTFVGKVIFFILAMKYGGGQIVSYFTWLFAWCIFTPFVMYAIWRGFKRYTLGIETYLSKSEPEEKLWLRLLGFKKKTYEYKVSELKNKSGDILADEMCARLLSLVFCLACLIIWFKVCSPSWSGG